MSAATEFRDPGQAKPVFAPWEPQFRADPHASLDALREQDPVHRFELLIGWVLTRYDDCAMVLRDGERFSSQVTTATVEERNRDREMVASLAPEVRFALDAFFERSLLFTDGLDHTRLRGLVGRAFTPRVVTNLRPRIQALVSGLLDPLIGAGPVDFMRRFAEPLPAIVIAELLGVAAEDRETFKGWSDGLVVLFDPVRAPEREKHALHCAGEMRAYLHDLFEERRRRPREDMVSRLVALESDGDALDGAELLAMCMLLLAAGHETTTNLLGNGLYLLLEHGEELRRLRREPQRVRTAIEEILRFESPVQGMPRVATRDFELRGRAISKGDYIVVLVTAANRDAAVFPDPHRFDIARRENHHLAFGLGSHFCLGAPLARAEAEIAFDTLLRRSPEMRGDFGSVEWKETIVMRGPRQLQVVL